MSIKQEKTENKNELKLTFTVEAAKFDEAIMKVFKQSAKYFNIPGFRKGKAPYKIVEKYYGANIFYEDAFNELVPEVYDEEIGLNFKIKEIYKKIKGLKEREKEIIIQRFGLNGKKPKTQKEIAREMGISRSYVSRIETKAIERLSSQMKEE